MDSGEVSVVIAHDEDLVEIFGSEMMSRVKSQHNPQWWVRIMVAINSFLFLFMNYETHNTAELRIRKVLFTQSYNVNLLAKENIK